MKIKHKQFIVGTLAAGPSGTRIARARFVREAFAGGETRSAGQRKAGRQQRSESRHHRSGSRFGFGECRAIEGYPQHRRLVGRWLVLKTQ